MEMLTKKEIIHKLHMEEIFLCEIMHIEVIPFTFAEIGEFEGMFVVSEEIIILDNKLLKTPFANILQIFIHELRHYYQLVKSKSNDDRYEMWNYEFKRGTSKHILDYLLSPLEIDAFAFSQVILEYVYGISYEKFPRELQEIINEYKQYNNLLDFDQ